MPPISYKHSGDMGDIIFSLPVIKALGKGTLYLDPEGGKEEQLVNWSQHSHTKLNALGITHLTRILHDQDYIEDIKLWKGEVVTHNLDEFRRHVKYNNLSDSHLAAFGLDFKERDDPWITIPPKTLEGKKIIINRSCRYHGNYSFWEQQVSASVLEKAVFIGYKKEYEYFCYTFPHLKVDYYNVEDGYEIAQLISGCELFMGNQGFPHSLAEAMKKNLVNEIFRPYPAAIFKREGAQYV
jgi:hypothetical protein